jgi:hypothetical protein
LQVFLTFKFIFKVEFSAINCFSSSNDCFKHFNLYFYPQFLFYVRNSGFHTYRGPSEFNYLLNYVKLMQKPIERIDNFDEFLDFVIKNDVGFFLFFFTK